MAARVTACSERFCAPTPPVNATLPLRFAIVAFVCNSTRSGGDADGHLGRALRFRRSLRRLGSTATTLAVVHGYDRTSQRALRRAGWQVLDVSAAVSPERLMRPIGSLAAGKAGKHWPRVLRRAGAMQAPSIESAVARATDAASLKLARANASVKNYLGNRTFSGWAKWCEPTAGCCSRSRMPCSVQSDERCSTMHTLPCHSQCHLRALCCHADDRCAAQPHGVRVRAAEAGRCRVISSHLPSPHIISRRCRDAASSAHLTPSHPIPHHLPSSPIISRRWEMPRHTDPSAHACGTLPLLAWNLSYDRVLVPDQRSHSA
jgi:hypothetical protein